MKPPTLAPAYACLFPGLAEIAQKHGYALAIHGSLQSDLDLVAIPWTNEATDAETLVNAVMIVASAYLPKGRPDRDPEKKPHGRLAWSLHMEAGAYIDLSVMPGCDHDREEMEASYLRHNPSSCTRMTRADLQRLSFEYLRNGPKPDWNARP